MIISLTNNSNRRWWLLFHILLGAAATFSNVFVIVWFYAVLVQSFYLLSFSTLNRQLVIAATMVYIGGFELIARMTKCSPIIPWEASKYLFTVFCIMGYTIAAKPATLKSYGWAIIALAIPAIFIDKSGDVSTNEIIFNVLGIINIGMGVLFFSTIRIHRSELSDLISLMVYACISVLVYTIIKTPDLDDIEFSLGAKFATSGEFGSNQVSTVLGLGFFVMAVSFILNWQLASSRILDGMIAIAFFIQGLLTFSRGGMIAALLSLVVFLYFVMKSGYQAGVIAIRLKQLMIPLIAFIFLAMVYVNEWTGGNLLLRYSGETYGTMLGTRDKNLATITSNRNIVFMNDIDLWFQHPVLGAGVGASKYLRSEGRGIPAHVELSRLLAEHGILGLFIFILFLFTSRHYYREPDMLVKALKLSLFSLAILTSFHSATRTFLTPLLISLCTINVVYNNPKNDIVPGQ